MSYNPSLTAMDGLENSDGVTVMIIVEEDNGIPTWQEAIQQN